NMTQEQFNELSDYVDQAHRLTASERAHGKTEADLKTEDIAAATALAKTLALSCDVGDATLAVKTANDTGYEVACKSGLGYFVVGRTSGGRLGMSCFEAEARRAMDAAQGRADSIVCKLPANADLKAMAAAVVTRVGHACTAQNLAWIGESAASHTE